MVNADLITASGFREQFPNSFIGSTDSEIERAKTIALSISFQSLLTGYHLMAHLLTLDEQDGGIDGGRGEVSRESLADRDVWYITQAKAGMDVFFTQTPYGRLFLILEKRSISHTLSILSV